MVLTENSALIVSLERVRAYVIDMDGVIYRGDTRLPHVAEFLSLLDHRDVPFLLATNNSSRTPDQYSEKLNQLGIAVRPDRILTSADATRTWLRNRFPEGTSAYVVGMQSLQDAIYEDGFFVPAEKDAELVVSGADRTLTFEKLKIATLAIRRGATYVATNADKTFPSEEGIIPGAGAIVAALSAASGVEPAIVGKPSPGMFEDALRRLETEPSETVMLGDRLDTDILGGKRANLKTLLVLTGVTSLHEARDAAIKPDLIVKDLSPLVSYYAGCTGRSD